MYQLDRNSFGLNTVTYTAKDKGKLTDFSETVTVYGNGILDQIALAVLRLLGTFISELKPIRFKLSLGTDRYQFPKEMYITRLALKNLFKVEIENWCSQKKIPLKEKTKENMIAEAFSAMHVSYNDEEMFFQNYLSVAIAKVQGTLFNRMNGFELLIAEKLGMIEGFEGEFEIPIDQRTGEIVTRADLLKSPDCYHARIKIQNDSEGRKAFFLKEKKGDESRDPAFSEEAQHTIGEVLKELKKFIGEEINLKQVAEKLKDAIFARKFLELDETPVLDRSLETRVVLNPTGDEFVAYEIANKITLGDETYIASNYPKFNEPWKYWSMLFEERSPVAVKLNEIQKKEDPEKDSSYWPAPGITYVYDFPEIGVDLKVKNVKEETPYPSFTKRVFQITQNNETIEVIHVDFIGWPDKGVPTEDEIQKLLHEVNQAYETQKASMCLIEEEKIVPPSSQVPEDKKSQNSEHAAPISDSPIFKKTPIHPGPIAVHCVGGVGRTGTFIGIHSSHKQKNPDFVKLVYEMRTQRSNRMIETEEQFLFMKNVHALYQPKVAQ